MGSTNSTYCNKGTTKYFTSRASFLSSLIACIPRDHITTGSCRLFSVSTRNKFILEKLPNSLETEDMRKIR